MVGKTGLQLVAVLSAVAALPLAAAPAAPPAETVPASTAQWSVIERYCYECHNALDWAGGVAFDTMSSGEIPNDAKVWEAAVKKLRAGFMPPPGAKQHPDNESVKGLVSWLEGT